MVSASKLLSAEIKEFKIYEQLKKKKKKSALPHVPRFPHLPHVCAKLKQRKLCPSFFVTLCVFAQNLIMCSR